MKHEVMSTTAGLSVALMLAASLMIGATYAENAAADDITRDVFATVNDIPDTQAEQRDRAARAEAALSMARLTAEQAEAEQAETAAQEEIAPVEESDEADYSAPSTYTGDFRKQGVVYDGGLAYTWYSQRVLPGAGLTDLNANGRTVNDGGYVVDGDGYIAVASSDYAKGTTLETPFGMAKVYDSGCPSGIVDVYTDF